MTRPQTPGRNVTFSLRDGRDWAIVCLLLLSCVLVRLPYYFESVLDWDESTFILMGQNLLDGHLPYVQLWDNKPPLAFAFFALTILFGKSIVVVRMAGTICVFLAAVTTWRAGDRIWSRDAGFVAAVLTVLFVSLFGQATLTETIALVPMMGALLVLFAGTSTMPNLFLAGCLISIATLIRTNLACLALAVGLVIAGTARASGLGWWLKRAGMYAVGGLVPLSLVFLPYAATGHARLFVDSVFLAPLRYAQEFSSNDASSVLLTGFDRWNVLLWGGFLGGVVLVATHWLRLDERRRYQLILVLVFLLSIAWSIASTGSPYRHYLIQIVPFLAIFAGILFNVLRRAVPAIPLLIALLIGLVASARPILDQYTSIAARLAENRPLRSDAGYRVAAYIAANNPSREPIYMMTNHIVYWFLGMDPITKSVTHPSTIGKEYLLKVFLGPQASSEGEMAALLGRKPLFLVKTEHPGFLPREAEHVLEAVLRTDYVLVETIDDNLIYRRVGR